MKRKIEKIEETDKAMSETSLLVQALHSGKERIQCLEILNNILLFPKSSIDLVSSVLRLSIFSEDEIERSYAIQAVPNLIILENELSRNSQLLGSSSESDNVSPATHTSKPFASLFVPILISLIPGPMGELSAQCLVDLIQQRHIDSVALSKSQIEDLLHNVMASTCDGSDASGSYNSFIIISSLIEAEILDLKELQLFLDNNKNSTEVYYALLSFINPRQAFQMLLPIVKSHVVLSKIVLECLADLIPECPDLGLLLYNEDDIGYLAERARDGETEKWLAVVQNVLYGSQFNRNIFTRISILFNDSDLIDLVSDILLGIDPSSEVDVQVIQQLLGNITNGLSLGHGMQTTVSWAKILNWTRRCLDWMNQRSEQDNIMTLLREFLNTLSAACSTNNWEWDVAFIAEISELLFIFSDDGSVDPLWFLQFVKKSEESALIKNFESFLSYRRDKGFDQR